MAQITSETAGTGDHLPGNTTSLVRKDRLIKRLDYQVKLSKPSNLVSKTW